MISLIILKLRKKQSVDVQQTDEQVANEKSLVASEISRIENKGILFLYLFIYLYSYFFIYIYNFLSLIFLK